MLKMLSSACLAMTVTFGSLAFTAPSVLAQTGFDIQIGPDGMRARPTQPEPPRRSGCSERQALAAAREEGLRNAEVIRMTERSITVEGDTRRGVRQMRFANQRGCPLA